ncbi:MAG: amidohydrolase family protein [Desulfobacterales bacterium]|nr:amidohydrolase family protein [Desulfobacterales bacterium]
MGRYAGRFVVDTHVHVQRASLKFKERGVKPSIGQMYAQVAELDWWDNSARCLYDMDRYGIDVCIIMCGGLSRGMDNDLDVSIALQHPDRFAVLCYPTAFEKQCTRGEAKWSVQGALQETEQRLKTGRYKGIGQGLPITEGAAYGRRWATREEKKKVELLSMAESLDRYRLFMDLAEKYQVAVAASLEGEILAQLAAEYPAVPMVVQLAGRGAGGRRKVEELCDVATGADNVYLEMGQASAEIYEVALSDPNVGPVQIVHGTDWGASHHIYSQPGRGLRGGTSTSCVDWIRKWGPPPYQTDYWGWSLHQIDRLRDTLTQDEINLILGGNAARIFKLDVPFTRLFPEEGRPDLWG